MNGRRKDKSIDPLDTALASLPRDVQPDRDLWAGISAQIEGTRPDAVTVAARPARSWMQLAAAVLLILASSITTYVVVHQSMQERVLAARRSASEQLQAAPAVPVMPASFGAEAMGPGYVKARAELDQEFQRRIATLPPVTRAKLERDLADLRRAAADISATLIRHPGDPLLRELLLSTYQSELGLLGSVTTVTNATETRL